MQKNAGLIKIIIIIIIGILILSFFSIDIRGIIESPTGQSNFNYVWGLVTFVWNEYLANPVRYFWNNIFIDLLWDSFETNLQKIKEGKPHDFIENPPQVPPASVLEVLPKTTQ